MVNKTFGERFAESKGLPIDYQGLTVHGIYRIQVSFGDKILIRFIKASSEVCQGLRLSIKNGTLLVNNQKLKDIVLWRSTAPDIVEITCNTKNYGSPLHVWNVWRDHNGTMQAWIGNAGMVIEEGSSATILRCSDGIGSPNFEDLVVEIRIVRSAPSLG